ncbi:MAG: DEAD/DEAH box helicase family protein [Deltaproteobacteria bacterium]|nr:DEAD/DEAH box helicase family protein [Deltaproteobacteria bacterium]
MNSCGSRHTGLKMPPPHSKMRTLQRPMTTTSDDGFRLRRWQAEALDRWQAAGHRGIVSVVTGGGKTVFALAAVRRLKPSTVLIVVPTLALLDQWWEETSAFLGLHMDEIHVISGKKRMRSGTVNLAVLNTASRLLESGNRLRAC